MTSPQPDTDRQQLALIAAYQAQSVALRAQIEAFIRALWQSLGVYREPQVSDFTSQAVPMVAGAQQQMSSLTAAFLAALSGKAAKTVPSKLVTGSAVRNGVPMTEVYGRPFHLVWRDLGAAQARRDAHYAWTVGKAGDGPQPPLGPADWVGKAIQAGEDRAVNLAQTDVQLAKTNTAQQVVSKEEKAIGYHRVLEGPYSCGLCIVASTNLYHKAALMPIHPGCDCSVLPVYSADTALLDAANAQHLSDAHQAIADRFGKPNTSAGGIPGQKGLRYKDVLIEHHNNEIGPVLGIRGQQFTTV